MNILYRACASRKGYQAKILRELYKKQIFEKCTIISQTLDGKDIYPKEIYHEIPAGIGYAANYNSICDMDSLPELSENLLTALREYENVAFNMTCRNYHMHIMYFDEMEEEYLQHVKFWNWILEEDKIEFVFLSTVPHHAWEYILYALAKIRKIPVLIESVANIPGLNEVGTSIETIGKNTGKCYETLEIVDMDKNVQKYYNKILEQREYISLRERNRKLKENKEWVYRTYYQPIVSRLLYCKRIYTDIIEKRTRDKLKKDLMLYKKDVFMMLRILNGRNKMHDSKYYNKFIAQAINYNKKYIYYALQYFPEASTLPRGGVFCNQLLAIKILAKCAQKYGIAVYVKEHWGEEGRTKLFYDKLSQIQNVYRLSTGEDTYKIIDHAVAVSSQTGTCMTESIVKGKPVLTFANHCLCGAPGVFRVGSEEDVDRALREIMSPNYVIDEFEVKKYFTALTKTLVKGYLDWPKNPEYDLHDCIDETVNLIETFVRNGMKEDFCYIKS